DPKPKSGSYATGVAGLRRAHRNRDRWFCGSFQQLVHLAWLASRNSAGFAFPQIRTPSPGWCCRSSCCSLLLFVYDRQSLFRGGWTCDRGLLSFGAFFPPAWFCARLPYVSGRSVLSQFAERLAGPHFPFGSYQRSSRCTTHGQHDLYPSYFLGDCLGVDCDPDSVPRDASLFSGGPKIGRTACVLTGLMVGAGFRALLRERRCHRCSLAL